MEERINPSKVGERRDWDLTITAESSGFFFLTETSQVTFRRSSELWSIFANLVWLITNSLNPFLLDSSTPPLFSFYTSLTTLSLIHSCPNSKPLSTQCTWIFSSNLLIGSFLKGPTELENLDGSLNMSQNLFSSEVVAWYGKFLVMIALDLRHNNLTGKMS